MVCEIPLTKGLVALVDDADFDRVIQLKWHAMKTQVPGLFYAVRTTNRERLHRFIMDVPTETEIDHINLDGLDCRRSNRRVATRSNNVMNRQKSRANTSGYKGVSRTNSGKWRAQIMRDYIQCVIGQFPTKEEAALAYDAKAREIFGDFARLNFPLEGERAA